MKSTMEEASSILKAIEQGWERAGKPASFSIKVLEEPEKNFFGLTVKSAKIAFLFDEKSAATSNNHHNQSKQPRQQNAKPARTHKDVKPERTKEQRQPIAQRKLETKAEQKSDRPRRDEQKQTRERSHERSKTTTQEKNGDRQPQADLWTSAMVEQAEQWLREAVMLLDLPAVTFTSDSNRYYLKIKFNGGLVENEEQERLLFSSFAHLLMQTLRQKYKKPLRGFKVVLNRA